MDEGSGAAHDRRPERGDWWTVAAIAAAAAGILFAYQVGRDRADGWGAADLLERAPWLGSRAVGLVAYGLLTGALLVTLAAAAGLPAARRSTLRDPLAAIGLAAVALHCVLLLADGWLDFWVVLGILAAVGAVAAVAAPRLAPRVAPDHVLGLAIGTWALAALHALGAGTDAGTRFLRGGVLLSALAVALLLALAARRARPATAAAEPQAEPPGPAPPAPATATSDHISSTRAPAPATLWARSHPEGTPH